MVAAMVDFEYLPWQVMVCRLVLAAGLGALVGQERERRDQPAGLRTHLLVSAGACVFTLVSVVVAGDTYDPGRIAAQIITGIGFLGAGTIIHHGASVRGLTTAASIWATAGVGMAAGVGWWQAGLAATLLLYLSLTCLKAAERRLFPQIELVCLEVELDPSKVSLAEMREQVIPRDREPVFREVRTAADRESTIATIELGEVSLRQATETIEQLSAIPGVQAVRRL
jgi:putative Mg2+ transporter-C (MgtC) family protein